MTPADVLEEFQITAAAPPRKSLSLKPEERQIYQVLSFEHPLTMDEIILSLPDGEIANLSYWLLNMELKGIVIENEMHAFRRAERE
jgi:DNA processing protein